MQRAEDNDKKFVLKVNPSNKTITRKASDLYNLRNKLQVEFPFYYVS